MIARRKGSHAGAGHVKYLHFVVICVTRCIYNKSAKLKRHDRKSFHNLKRKGISGTVGGERFEMLVAAYITHEYVALRCTPNSSEIARARESIVLVSSFVSSSSPIRFFRSSAKYNAVGSLRASTFQAGLDFLRCRFPRIKKSEIVVVNGAFVFSFLRAFGNNDRNAILDRRNGRRDTLVVARWRQTSVGGNRYGRSRCPRGTSGGKNLATRDGDGSSRSKQENLSVTRFGLEMLDGTRNRVRWPLRTGGDLLFRSCFHLGGFAREKHTGDIGVRWKYARRYSNATSTLP